MEIDQRPRPRRDSDAKASHHRHSLVTRTKSEPPGRASEYEFRGSLVRYTRKKERAVTKNAPKRSKAAVLIGAHELRGPALWRACLIEVRGPGRGVGHAAKLTDHVPWCCSLLSPRSSYSCILVCVYVCGCVAVLCVSVAWAVVLLTCPRYVVRDTLYAIRCTRYVVRDTLYAALIRAATALGPPDSSGHASPVFASPMIPIAIGHAILAALFIFCAAAGSGGHIVNTITLATAITGHTAWVRCFLYLIVQTLGSIVGTVAVRAMIGWDSATYVGLGGCELGSLSVGGAFLSEFFCTFSLLLVGAWPCAVQCVAG